MNKAKIVCHTWDEKEGHGFVQFIPEATRTSRDGTTQTTRSRGRRWLYPNRGYALQDVGIDTAAKDVESILARKEASA